MEPLKLSLAQICATSGESLHTIYAAINQGHLDTFLVGRRRCARPEAVRKWVDYLEAESKAGRPGVYRPRSSERRGGADALQVFVARLGAVSAKGGDPRPLFEEIAAAGLTKDVQDLIGRFADPHAAVAQAAEADALARERRGRIGRGMK